MTLPNVSESFRAWATRLDWCIACGLTLGAIVLQVVNMLHAGGLWRDEAAAVNLAQSSSWSVIAANLEHESFPLLLTAIIRTWSALGLGAADNELRILGLLISLGIFASLWWNSRSLTAGPPLLSLLLVGLSPVCLRWGGSLRAYGLGVLLIVLAIAAMWQLLALGSRRRWLTAAVLNLLAVHALYQNAIVVAAICLAGISVAATRRNWHLAITVFLAGAIPALSLLPYVGVIRRASAWNVTTHVPIDFDRIWTVLNRALAAAGAWMPWLWAALLVSAGLAGLMCLMIRRADKGRAPAEFAGFLLGIAAATTLGYYLFLTSTKFPTEEWYYLLWMAVAAVAIDALIARATENSPARLLRPLVALVAAVCVFPVALRSVQTRATNVDLIAQRLNQSVTAGDLVVIHPWFCAVSLARYYTGPGELTTLPPLGDYTLQRLDLLKEQMMNEAAMQPAVARMENTLRSGGTIWLVGHFPFANPPEPAPRLPRAGDGPEGWRAAPYLQAYGMETASFLQTRALKSERVEIAADHPVHPFEDLAVRTISGWRSGRAPW